MPRRKDLSEYPDCGGREHTVRPNDLWSSSRVSIFRRFPSKQFIADKSEAPHAEFAGHGKDHLARNYELVGDAVYVHSNVDVWNQKSSRRNLKFRTIPVGVQTPKDHIAPAQELVVLLPLPIDSLDMGMWIDASDKPLGDCRFKRGP